MTAQLALRLDAPDPRAYVLDVVESLARVRRAEVQERGGEGARDHSTALDRGATMRVEKERPRDATNVRDRDRPLRREEARPMKRRYHQPDASGKVSP